MKCGIVTCLTFGALLMTAAPTGAQRAREDEGKKYGWLSSLEEGKAEARRSGKPLMVVLRCVPCDDCRAFDGQVARLEKIKDTADQFVRVRLTRIEPLDLSLFDFDYDLTFAIFFLSADDEVYSRYGGRDAENADKLQSLAGLEYTMKSVLRVHESKEKVVAPRSQAAPRFVRDVPGGMGLGRGCLHCHELRVMLDSELRQTRKWTRDMLWRYPLPETVGLQLETERGNVVREVNDRSPAAVGLKTGDVLRRLNGVPIHSLADAQFALDRAPRTGSIDVVWQRGDKLMESKLALADGWRRGDIVWRSSLMHLMPSAPVYGKDLTADEKKAIGLTAKQLAFRQKDYVLVRAQEIGVQAGDVILGVDGKALEMGVEEFHRYIRGNYLVGDRVVLNILRGGKRMNLDLTLAR